MRGEEIPNFRPDVNFFASEVWGGGLVDALKKTRNRFHCDFVNVYTEFLSEFKGNFVILSLSPNLWPEAVLHPQ